MDDPAPSGAANTTPGCTTGASPRRSPDHAQGGVGLAGDLSRGGRPRWVHGCLRAGPPLPVAGSARTSPALERELGVQLIDRTRRPADRRPRPADLRRARPGDPRRRRLRPIGDRRPAGDGRRVAGRADHAVHRRRAVPRGARRAARRHPGVRVALSEQAGWTSSDGIPAEGFVLAVLPTLAQPHRARPAGAAALAGADQAGGARRSRAGPDAASGGSPAPSWPSIRWSSAGCIGAPSPEILPLLGRARAGRAAPRRPWTPRRRWSRWSGPASESASPTRSPSSTPTPPALSCVDIDDPDMVREVAVYWYDVLLSTEVGTRAARAVLRAPPCRPGAARRGTADGEPDSADRWRDGPRGGRVGVPSGSGQPGAGFAARPSTKDTMVPFVGRQPELAVLRARLADALAGRRRSC